MFPFELFFFWLVNSLNVNRIECSLSQMKLCTQLFRPLHFFRCDSRIHGMRMAQKYRFKTSYPAPAPVYPAENLGASAIRLHLRRVSDDFRVSDECGIE